MIKLKKCLPSHTKLQPWILDSVIQKCKEGSTVTGCTTIGDLVINAIAIGNGEYWVQVCRMESEGIFKEETTK